jgi:hypothetical protein
MTSNHRMKVDYDPRAEPSPPIPPEVWDAYPYSRRYVLAIVDCSTPDGVERKERIRAKCDSIARSTGETWMPFDSDFPTVVFGTVSRPFWKAFLELGVEPETETD